MCIRDRIEGEEDIDRDAVKEELSALTEELETARENAKVESARDRHGKDEDDTEEVEEEKPLKK